MSSSTFLLGLGLGVRSSISYIGPLSVVSSTFLSIQQYKIGDNRLQYGQPYHERGFRALFFLC